LFLREHNGHYDDRQDYIIIDEIIIKKESDMSTAVTVNKVLEEIDQLDIEDRTYIHQILSRRLIDAERSLIAKRARDAEKNYSHGHVHSGSVHDLFSELND